MEKIAEDVQKKLELMTAHADGYKELVEQAPNHWVAVNTALLVANQAVNDTMIATTPDVVRQLSVPSIVHTFLTLPHELFGFQAMVANANEEPVYYLEKAGDQNSIKSIIPNIKATQSMVLAGTGKIPSQEIPHHVFELSLSLTDEIVGNSIKAMNSAADIKRVITVKESTQSAIEKLILASIQEASDDILDKTGRSANFIAMPLMIARILKAHIASEYDFDGLPSNIRRIGFLKNRWVVFINGLEGEKTLVGYRGSHHFDAGMIVAPRLVFYNVQETTKKSKGKMGVDGHPIPEGTKQPKQREWTVQQLSYRGVVRPDYFCSLQFRASPTNEQMLGFEN
jgi:hypothetical protein